MLPGAGHSEMSRKQCLSKINDCFLDEYHGNSCVNLTVWLRKGRPFRECPRISYQHLRSTISVDFVSQTGDEHSIQWRKEGGRLEFCQEIKNGRTTLQEDLWGRFRATLHVFRSFITRIRPISTIPVAFVTGFPESALQLRIRSHIARNITLK